MNIGAVMDDLAAALETIDGLRVFPYWSDRITPPAAVISWPEPLTFDASYRRGADTATFPITILVGKVDARSTRDALSQYADGSGAGSVKQAIDEHDASSYGDATVRGAEFEQITVAGNAYMAAVFEVAVVGSGR